MIEENQNGIEEEIKENQLLEDEGEKYNQNNIQNLNIRNLNLKREKYYNFYSKTI